MDSQPPTERRILTPSGLTAEVRGLLERAYFSVWIEGELSNVARPASGHLYFTLKDSAAQVRAAMFKPRSTWLPFKPVDGAQVLCRARVSLYEARGEFQLIVEHMELAGEGALRREFEQLKSRLQAEGLFASEAKRPIPALPRRIGILTSPTGAALHDVLHVLSRRFPLVEVEVLPVPVQGKDAPAAIIAALDQAAVARRHDVLLLTRGGGSLEDLWAFNDEGMARAIARNPIPIVAAIGHEVDISIAELVADLRAATPSAAAERLVPDSNEIARRMTQARDRLGIRIRRALEARILHLDHLHARLGQQQPGQRLRLGRERLTQLQGRLAQVTLRTFGESHARLAQARLRLHAQHPAAGLQLRRDHHLALGERLRRASRHGLDQRRARLERSGAALHALSPMATLSRGYAILLEPGSGQVVRQRAQARPGTRLLARLADGELSLRVEGD